MGNFLFIKFTEEPEGTVEKLNSFIRYEREENQRNKIMKFNNISNQLYENSIFNNQPREQKTLGRQKNFFDSSEKIIKSGDLVALKHGYYGGIDSYLKFSDNINLDKGVDSLNNTTFFEILIDTNKNMFQLKDLGTNKLVFMHPIENLQLITPLDDRGFFERTLWSLRETDPYGPGSVQLWNYGSEQLLGLNNNTELWYNGLYVRDDNLINYNSSRRGNLTNGSWEAMFIQKICAWELKERYPIDFLEKNTNIYEPILSVRYENWFVVDNYKLTYNRGPMIDRKYRVRILEFNKQTKSWYRQSEEYSICEMYYTNSTEQDNSKVTGKIKGKKLTIYNVIEFVSWQGGALSCKKGEIMVLGNDKAEPNNQWIEMCYECPKLYANTSKVITNDKLTYTSKLQPNKECPEGFDKDEYLKYPNCGAGWTAECGIDCRKDQCAKAGGRWEYDGVGAYMCYMHDAHIPSMNVIEFNGNDNRCIKKELSCNSHEIISQNKDELIKKKTELPKCLQCPIFKKRDGVITVDDVLKNDSNINKCKNIDGLTCKPGEILEYNPNTRKMDCKLCDPINTYNKYKIKFNNNENKVLVENIPRNFTLENNNRKITVQPEINKIDNICSPQKAYKFCKKDEYLRGSQEEYKKPDGTRAYSCSPCKVNQTLPFKNYYIRHSKTGDFYKQKWNKLEKTNWQPCVDYNSITCGPGEILVRNDNGLLECKKCNNLTEYNTKEISYDKGDFIGKNIYITDRNNERPSLSKIIFTDNKTNKNREYDLKNNTYIKKNNNNICIKQNDIKCREGTWLLNNNKEKHKCTHVGDNQYFSHITTYDKDKKKKVISKSGELYRENTTDILNPLDKVAWADVLEDKTAELGNMIIPGAYYLRRKCPINYDTDYPNNYEPAYCTAGWMANCGYDCHLNNCNNLDGIFKHKGGPYICELDIRDTDIYRLNDNLVVNCNDLIFEKNTKNNESGVMYGYYKKEITKWIKNKKKFTCNSTEFSLKEYLKHYNNRPLYPHPNYIPPSISKDYKLDDLFGFPQKELESEEGTIINFSNIKPNIKVSINNKTEYNPYKKKYVPYNEKFITGFELKYNNKIQILKKNNQDSFNNITTTSVYSGELTSKSNPPIGNKYSMGWLNSNSGWEPKVAQKGEWWEIDLKKERIIVGLATQGNYINYSGRVTKAKIGVGQVKEKDGSLKINYIYNKNKYVYMYEHNPVRYRSEKINGNMQDSYNFITHQPENEDVEYINQNTIFVNKFQATKGRYIRIFVEEFSKYPSMRCAVIVQEEKFYYSEMLNTNWIEVNRSDFINKYNKIYKKTNKNAKSGEYIIKNTDGKKDHKIMPCETGHFSKDKNSIKCIKKITECPEDSYLSINNSLKKDNKCISGFNSKNSKVLNRTEEYVMKAGLPTETSSIDKLKVSGGEYPNYLKRYKLNNESDDNRKAEWWHYNRNSNKNEIGYYDFYLEKNRNSYTEWIDEKSEKVIIDGTVGEQKQTHSLNLITNQKCPEKLHKNDNNSNIDKQSGLNMEAEFDIKQNKKNIVISRIDPVSHPNETELKKKNDNPRNLDFKLEFYCKDNPENIKKFETINKRTLKCKEGEKLVKVNNNITSKDFIKNAFMHILDRMPSIEEYLKYENINYKLLIKTLMESEEFISKKKYMEKFNTKIGLYYKYINNDKIYFSNNNDLIKNDITFTNMSKLKKHKIQNGWETDEKNDLIIADNFNEYINNLKKKYTGINLNESSRYLIKPYWNSKKHGEDRNLEVRPNGRCPVGMKNYPKCSADINSNHNKEFFIEKCKESEGKWIGAVDLKMSPYRCNMGDISVERNKLELLGVRELMSVIPNYSNDSIGKNWKLVNMYINKRGNIVTDIISVEIENWSMSNKIYEGFPKMDINFPTISKENNLLGIELISTGEPNTYYLKNPIKEEYLFVKHNAKEWDSKKLSPVLWYKGALPNNKNYFKFKFVIQCDISIWNDRGDYPRCLAKWKKNCGRSCHNSICDDLGGIFEYNGGPYICNMQPPLIKLSILYSPFNLNGKMEYKIECLQNNNNNNEIIRNVACTNNNTVISILNTNIMNNINNIWKLKNIFINKYGNIEANIINNNNQELANLVYESGSSYNIINARNSINNSLPAIELISTGERDTYYLRNPGTKQYLFEDKMCPSGFTYGNIPQCSASWEPNCEIDCRRTVCTDTGGLFEVKGQTWYCNMSKSDINTIMWKIPNKINNLSNKYKFKFINIYKEFELKKIPIETSNLDEIFKSGFLKDNNCEPCNNTEFIDVPKHDFEICFSKTLCNDDHEYYFISDNNKNDNMCIPCDYYKFRKKDNYQYSGSESKKPELCSEIINIDSIIVSLAYIICFYNLKTTYLYLKDEFNIENINNLDNNIIIEIKNSESSNFINNIRKLLIDKMKKIKNSEEKKYKWILLKLFMIKKLWNLDLNNLNFTTNHKKNLINFNMKEFLGIDSEEYLVMNDLSDNKNFFNESVDAKIQIPIGSLIALYNPYKKTFLSIKNDNLVQSIVIDNGILPENKDNLIFEVLNGGTGTEKINNNKIKTIGLWNEKNKKLIEVDKNGIIKIQNEKDENYKNNNLKDRIRAYEVQYLSRFVIEDVENSLIRLKVNYNDERLSKYVALNEDDSLKTIDVNKIDKNNEKFVNFQIIIYKFNEKEDTLKNDNKKNEIKIKNEYKEKKLINYDNYDTFYKKIFILENYIKHIYINILYYYNIYFLEGCNNDSLINFIVSYDYDNKIYKNIIKRNIKTLKTIKKIFNIDTENDCYNIINNNTPDFFIEKLENIHKRCIDDQYNKNANGDMDFEENIENTDINLNIEGYNDLNLSEKMKLNKSLRAQNGVININMKKDSKLFNVDIENEFINDKIDKYDKNKRFCTKNNNRYIKCNRTTNTDEFKKMINLKTTSKFYEDKVIFDLIIEIINKVEYEKNKNKDNVHKRKQEVNKLYHLLNKGCRSPISDLTKYKYDSDTNKKVLEKNDGNVIYNKLNEKYVSYNDDIINIEDKKIDTKENCYNFILNNELGRELCCNNEICIPSCNIKKLREKVENTENSFSVDKKYIDLKKEVDYEIDKNTEIVKDKNNLIELGCYKDLGNKDNYLELINVNSEEKNNKSELDLNNIEFYGLTSEELKESVNKRNTRINEYVKNIDIKLDDAYINYGKSKNKNENIDSCLPRIGKEKLRSNYEGVRVDDNINFNKLDKNDMEKIKNSYKSDIEYNNKSLNNLNNIFNDNYNYDINYKKNKSLDNLNPVSLKTYYNNIDKNLKEIENKQINQKDKLDELNSIGCYNDTQYREYLVEKYYKDSKLNCNENKLEVNNCITNSYNEEHNKEKYDSIRNTLDDNKYINAYKLCRGENFNKKEDIKNNIKNHIYYRKKYMNNIGEKNKDRKLRVLKILYLKLKKNNQLEKNDDDENYYRIFFKNYKNDMTNKDNMKFMVQVFFDLINLSEIKYWGNLLKVFYKNNEIEYTSKQHKKSRKEFLKNIYSILTNEINILEFLHSCSFMIKIDISIFGDKYVNEYKKLRNDIEYDKNIWKTMREKEMKEFYRNAIPILEEDGNETVLDKTF